MNSFDFLWQLLDEHGAIPNLKAEASLLWNTFAIDEQRAIYRNIKAKISAGKFVNYNPVKAIRDNAPKKQQQVLTYEQYFERFRTTDERDGWKRLFMPEEQRTIYVKQ